MNIYAVKDIMIGYFMLPFCAPDDHTVLAAIATKMNDPTADRRSDALLQAPHHFQVWKLGSIDQDGLLTPQREMLAECSSLIRSPLRPNATGTDMSLDLGPPPTRVAGSETPPN